MPVVQEDEYLSLIHLSSPDDWEKLTECCHGWLQTEDSKDRVSDATKLKNYLEPVAKSVLIEKHYHDKDYRDTYCHYYAKKFAAYPTGKMDDYRAYDPFFDKLGAKLGVTIPRLFRAK
jgi:hypothetical protein